MNQAFPQLFNYYSGNNPVVPMQANQFQPVTQQGAQLVRVNGIESAKAYPTQPNSTVALFDAEDDIMYIKSTDASNFPTIRQFRFTEIVEQEKVSGDKYVTIEEFNKFKEEVLNAQQSLRNERNRKYSAKSKWNDGSDSAGKKPDVSNEKQQ